MKWVTVITPKYSSLTYLIRECVYACVRFSWHGFFQSILSRDEMHTLYNKVLPSDLHLHHRICPAVKKKNIFLISLQVCLFFQTTVVFHIPRNITQYIVIWCNILVTKIHYRLSYIIHISIYIFSWKLESTILSTVL